jgi:hypothetical protein
MAFTDDFTGSENQELEARTGWTKPAGTRYARINASNQLKAVPNGSVDAHFVCTDQGSANHYTQADVHIGNGTNNSFLTIRMTDADNFIGVRLYTTGWQLYKRVAGTFTQLGATYIDTSTPGDTIKLEGDGNSINVYLNTALIIGPETETFNNTETSQGLVVRDTLTKDPWIDNFEAGVVGAGDSIDSIDSPVLDAETGNAFTTSGMSSGTVDSFTIETAGSEYSVDLSASLAGSAGSYTWDMPDIAAITSSAGTDGLPFDTASWGSKIVTAGNGTESATSTTVINEKTNWHVVEVASPLTTIGYLFYVAGGWAFGAAANTDQIYYYSTETVDTGAVDYFNISAAGLITTNLTTGSVPFLWWDATNGKWYADAVDMSGFTQAAGSNQGKRQQAFRAKGGTTGSYNEDVIAACKAYLGGSPTGTIDELMIKWLSDKLSTTGGIQELMNKAAADRGKGSWNQLDGDDIYTLLS